MSAEDRLQALEQLVTVMLLLLKLDSEQQKRKRGEGVADPRLLGKPKNFDGMTDNWRQFNSTFLGYAGAVDS